jgi:hypothetical protein
MVKNKFRSVLNAAAAAAEKNNGRSIVFVHYAGCAELDGGRLIFTPSYGRLWKGAIFGSTSPPINRSMVFLFDCYYPYLATDDYPGYRVVEVLAAMGIKSPGAIGEVSFTGELAAKVASLKEQGQRSVELAELISMLREESPGRLEEEMPCHFLRMGTSSATWGYLWFGTPSNGLQIARRFEHHPVGQLFRRGVAQLHPLDSFLESNGWNNVGRDLQI